mgnify:CR=1 FL=1
MNKNLRLDVMMQKLNNLSNQIKKCEEPGMKQLWTDKWYQLVKQYAATIQ